MTQAVIADAPNSLRPLGTGKAATLARPVKDIMPGVGGGKTDGPQLEDLFQMLTEQWRKETGMLSSLSKKVQHPAYLKIIAMGECMVPFILRELRDRPAHWFEALRVITKQTPVSPEERSDPKKAREAWLKWGRQRGFIE